MTNNWGSLEYQWNKQDQQLELMFIGEHAGIPHKYNKAISKAELQEMIA